MRCMQFTGLKDKNGVDIYEGDILDFDETEWRGKFKPEVVPCLCEFVKSWPLCGTSDDVAYYRSAVGNIYENPELLK